MIDYDSFSRCHLTDIFFAFHAGAKELIKVKAKIEDGCSSDILLPCLQRATNICAPETLC